MSTVAVSAFAGIGFGVALERLGITELGIENDEDVWQTRKLAGMTTFARDVWDVSLPAMKLAYDLYTAGPPCQTFTHVGKGHGRADLGVIGDILERMATKVYTLEAFYDGIRNLSLRPHADPRTSLVLLPLLHILRDRPRAVVLEQVPPVLVLWEAYADVLRAYGYSVDAGMVDAEMFGVPQTRKRAVLVANRDMEVVLPQPTHSHYHPRHPARLDQGVKPWVSMADALGGGESHWKPSDLVGFPRKADGRDEGVEIAGVEYRSRDLRPADRPAWAITSKTRSWKRWGFEDRPAPTITGHGPASRHPSGTQRAYLRAIEAGTFTLREPWDVSSARKPTYDGQSLSRSYEREATSITIPEGLLLQTFPPEFPLYGNRNSQWQQIGNAVPPLLAERLILAALGHDQIGYTRYA